MFRAEQQRLYHETNVELVELRHLEITYYFNVNSAIGTQAALIAGFIYGLFTQTIPRDYIYADYFLSAYYITSTISLFACIHIVMNTMIVQILGPGLALHGPAGSMALAAETMREEMRQVITSFIIMIIFFALATVICFWVVMDVYSAIAGTVCFFIAARQWIFYGKRIYWRLYFDRSQVELFEANDDPIDPDILAKGKTTADSGYRASESRANDPRRSSMIGSLFQNSIMKKPKKETTASDEGLEIRDSTTFSNVPDPKHIAMEGYMTKKIPSRELTVTQSSWERRYYVLNFAGVLAPFASRQGFHCGQASTVKERPLDIEDFFIHMDATLIDFAESEKASTVLSGDTSDSKKSSSAKKEKLKIYFMSRDEDDNRRLVFRCETLEDAELWMEAFAKVSPSSMKSPK